MTIKKSIKMMNTLANKTDLYSPQMVDIVHQWIFDFYTFQIIEALKVEDWDKIERTTQMFTGLFGCIKLREEDIENQIKSKILVIILGVANLHKEEDIVDSSILETMKDVENALLELTDEEKQTKKWQLALLHVSIYQIAKTAEIIMSQEADEGRENDLTTLMKEQFAVIKSRFTGEEFQSLVGKCSHLLEDVTKCSSVLKAISPKRYLSDIVFALASKLQPSHLLLFAKDFVVNDENSNSNGLDNRSDLDFLIEAHGHDLKTVFSPNKEKELELEIQAKKENIHERRRRQDSPEERNEYQLMKRPRKPLRDGDSHHMQKGENKKRISRRDRLDSSSSHSSDSDSDAADQSSSPHHRHRRHSKSPSSRKSHRADINRKLSRDKTSSANEATSSERNHCSSPRSKSRREVHKRKQITSADRAGKRRREDSPSSNDDSFDSEDSFSERSSFKQRDGDGNRVDSDDGSDADNPQSKIQQIAREHKHPILFGIRHRQHLKLADKKPPSHSAVKVGKWLPEEEEKFILATIKYGEGNWMKIQQKTKNPRSTIQLKDKWRQISLNRVLSVAKAQNLTYKGAKLMRSSGK